MSQPQGGPLETLLLLGAALVAFGLGGLTILQGHPSLLHVPAGVFFLAAAWRRRGGREIWVQGPRSEGEAMALGRHGVTQVALTALDRGAPTPGTRAPTLAFAYLAFVLASFLVGLAGS